MCMFLDDTFVNFRYFLFAVTLLGTVAMYQQLMDLRSNAEQARTNSDRIPYLETSLKNIQRSVDRMKEDLQESQAMVRRFREELRLYKSDKTGLVDYAYGGRAMVVGDTETLETRGLALFGVRICGQAGLEQRVLEPDVLPGDCWPLRGQKGAVAVELVEAVVVTQVSLEHAVRDLLPAGSQASAPREFSLWGVPEDARGPDDLHLFGNFEFSNSGPEVQTFTVLNETTKAFRMVEFRVLSNHGHPDFTCVYRLRVHGHPPQ